MKFELIITQNDQKIVLTPEGEREQAVLGLLQDKKAEIKQVVDYGQYGKSLKRFEISIAEPDLVEEYPPETVKSKK